MNKLKSEGAQASWLHQTSLTTSQVNKDTVTKQSKHYKVDG